MTERSSQLSETFRDGDPLVTALVWEVDRAVKQAMLEGGRYDTTIRHILNEYLRGHAPTPARATPEMVKAAYKKYGSDDIFKIEGEDWLEAVVNAAIAAHSPFYGAQCPSYPNCTGGCGLGCTREIEGLNQ